MENIVQDSIIKQSFINSIDREELLLKKYDEYNSYFEDNEFKELLKEFQETAREHIDILKHKLQKLDI